MFSENFSFVLPACVNFVGGGGKSGVILKLQEEYSESIPVVYTTTTRIHPPHPSEGLVVLSSNNERILKLMIERAATQWCGCRRFVVARVSENPDLFPGVSSGFGAALNPAIIPLILNEADGARSMSLKMPRQGEPVLMTGSKYLVPVIGLDCLNQPLGASTLFRWEYAREQFGLHEGDILSPDRLASILFHPQGVCKDWRPEMKIIPYINKVDAYEDRESALMLAEALLKNANFPVHHVVWGSVKSGISGQVASA